MPIAAAAITGGAGLLGGLLSDRSSKKAAKKAQKYNDQQRAAAFEYLQGVRGGDQLYAGLQESALKAGHKQELGGFQVARSALNRGGINAGQTVRAQGKINQANVEQSIVSRGLLGTSTGVQSLQSVGDRTASQLGAIDAQLGQAFADLGLQEGSIRGEQGDELAQLLGQTRQNQLALGYELASLAPRKPAAAAKSNKQKFDLSPYLGRRAPPAA